MACSSTEERRSTEPEVRVRVSSSRHRNWHIVQLEERRASNSVDTGSTPVVSTRNGEQADAGLLHTPAKGGSG